MESVFNNKEILVLPSWYPNSLDAYTGDFIQRHVKAIGEKEKQFLLFVVKDVKGEITKGVKVTETTTGNVTERIIYYYIPATGIRLLDQYLSHKKYLSIYQTEIRQYIKKQGTPKLVHVHVAMKAGLIAAWVKKKWAVPYIVSEHWTAYLPEAKLTIADFPRIFKHQLLQVLGQASIITVVSHVLGKAIQQLSGGLPYVLIPNVVDQTIFYPDPSDKSGKIRLIHISGMDYQKNAEDIIRALGIWKSNGGDFILNCFGPANDELKKLVAATDLSDRIFFHGEVAQPVLAAAIRQSDALVLYSRYETFGCVLIEANACGVPVIVSQLKVFEELVTDNFNGLFSAGEDPAALASTLAIFEKKKKDFNSGDIAAAVSHKYNYQKVAQQFIEQFNQVNVKSQD